jgi:hypothetical protein
MAELERIKKERAEEKLRKVCLLLSYLLQSDDQLGFRNIMVVLSLQDRQQAEEEAKMKEAELMRGNPLININNPGSFSIKRRSGVADVVPIVLYASMILQIELFKRLMVILTLFYMCFAGGTMMLFSRTRLVERPRHLNASSTTL